MAIDHIAVIRDDQALFHEGPSGVLERLPGWGSGASFPETTPQPPGWTAYVPWGHLMRDATGAQAPLSAADAGRPWTDPRARLGNSAPNTRAHLRHQQMLWLLGNGQWIVDYYGDQMGDVIYPFDWFESNQSSMPSPNFRLNEPGGGSSMRAISLANDPRNPGNPNQYRDWQWHPFGNRRPIPSGWVGALSVIFGRRILEDTAGPDDRARASLLLGCSWDWYQQMNLTQPPMAGVNVTYGGFSRLKYLTNDWQIFANTNLTEAQLRANPPPIIGLSLLDGVAPPPPPPTLPPATFSKGRWFTRLDAGRGRWISKNPENSSPPGWQLPAPVARYTAGDAVSVRPQLANPGTPAATFSKASGAAWASVNAATGEITGTIPVGVFEVSVRATNASAPDGVDILVSLTGTAVVVPTPGAPVSSGSMVAPRVPLVDGRGMIGREWYRLLAGLASSTAALTRVSDRQIASLVLTGTASAVYTATSSTTVKSASLANSTGAAVQASVWIVPAGGGPDVTNVVVPNITIAPGTSYACPELVGQVIEAGAALYARGAGITFIVTGTNQA